MSTAEPPRDVRQDHSADRRLASDQCSPPKLVPVDLQRGAYRGRARALNAEQVGQLRQRVAEGAAKATLAREFGVSRETIYQYLRPNPRAERAD